MGRMRDFCGLVRPIKFTYLKRPVLAYSRTPFDPLQHCRKTGEEKYLGFSSELIDDLERSMDVNWVEVCERIVQEHWERCIVKFDLRSPDGEEQLFSSCS